MQSGKLEPTSKIEKNKTTAKKKEKKKKKNGKAEVFCPITCKSGKLFTLDHANTLVMWKHVVFSHREISHKFFV